MPHGAVHHPYNLGRFPPLQLARSRLQNYFLRFHHPLHFRGRNLLFAVFHSEQLFLTDFSKRTSHLLIDADNSHATDNLF
jgi:hypothetical protein